MRTKCVPPRPGQDVPRLLSLEGCVPQVGGVSSVGGRDKEWVLEMLGFLLRTLPTKKKTGPPKITGNLG